ncbi:hypothetical protein BU16DRAFT_499982 [Lophium mytilinum]|uniref:PHD finger domain-containing protein n=1 Tax=Lophium mytilinum TaxID=390894 RepID=A0A6A6R9N2_9PEZI|nr:hypothetical protein BU16DRAFT_499982 [Lophium mytilinum]
MAPMSPIEASPRKRIRSSTRPTSRRSHAPDSASGKKLKYIPGGPGGGGRYVDETTGHETPVGGTGPGGFLYTGPRGAVGQRNRERGIVMPTATSPSATPTNVRPRRDRAPRPPAGQGPRSTSATASAAAVAQGEGFKPREERTWDEFHPDLDPESDFMIFSADDVDGISPPETKTSTPTNGLGQYAVENGASALLDEAVRAHQDILSMAPESPSFPTLDGDTVTVNVNINVASFNGSLVTPAKRRVGRPPRRTDAMLYGLGSPPVPRITPAPTRDPKERLNLQKPSYRQVDPFALYEQDQSVQVNYVDRAMASAGYQESDIFFRSEKHCIRVAEGSIEEDLDLAVKSDGDASAGYLPVSRVEYDMDEQDDRWLDGYNVQRKEEAVEPIKPAIFEITITQIEKEWHALEKRIPKPNPKPPQTHRPRSSSAAAVNGEPAGQGEEQDTKCAICDDGDCENTNAIVFCDGCDLAVHQECYGVPFIPEGQWLCRRCQLVGRGTPVSEHPGCIFCPNIEGAFKQTTSMKWSHLLCAIWIPEVSLGNTTFMEPVQDVEKVPRSRWKLSCYICKQKMGACVQCGNKSCYEAFHVTCARRARLFLKMKSSGSSGTTDASVLKAFCDKHCPPEWRRENDVERATADAKAFYRHTMRHARWGDSQMIALQIGTSQPVPSVEGGDDFADDGAVGNKRKRGQSTKSWRLPSGAPVVPQAVYHNVENSLIRFSIRRRKEYVAEACKYWTLKREARRGAALLKRLQLQMEAFSSMEITRRNFAGMGAAGRPRLQRRIEFAESLEDDTEQIRVLCNKVKEREAMKLADAQLLKAFVDIIYLPIPVLLWPILEKAQALDPKNVFYEGFHSIQTKLEERFYTSASNFTDDILAVLSSVIGFAAITDPKNAHDQLNGVSHNSLTPEQKELKKLAKRIIKAIQGPLDDAAMKESHLVGKPFEKDLPNLEVLLDQSLHRQQVLAASNVEAAAYHVANRINEVEVRGNESTNADEDTVMVNCINGHAHTPDADADDVDAMADEDADDEAIRLQVEGEALNVANTDAQLEHVAGNSSGGDAPALSHSGSTNPSTLNPEPLTPPRSERELLAQRSHGGVPWYMEAFDPNGMTIYEERWTGRDVLRDMSVELSELGDAELDELADPDEQIPVDETVPEAVQKSAKKKKNNRWRGYR